METTPTESTEEYELLRKIAALRKTRAELQAKLSHLTIQLDTYEDAARMVYGRDQYQTFISALMGETVPSMPTIYGAQETTGPKRRRMSTSWATMLVSLKDLPSFGYEQIVAVSGLKELGITLAAARSQMKTYIDGTPPYVERVGDGMFKVTKAGLDAATNSLGRAGVQAVALTAEEHAAAVSRYAQFDDLLGHADDNDVNPDEVPSTISAKDAFS